MLCGRQCEPFALLLAAPVLYPFVEGSDVGRPLFSVFGIAIKLRPTCELG